MYQSSLSKSAPGNLKLPGAFFDKLDLCSIKCLLNVLPVSPVVMVEVVTTVVAVVTVRVAAVTVGGALVAGHALVAGQRAVVAAHSAPAPDAVAAARHAVGPGGSSGDGFN